MVSDCTHLLLHVKSQNASLAEKAVATVAMLLAVWAFLTYFMGTFNLYNKPKLETKAKYCMNYNNLWGHGAK